MIPGNFLDDNWYMGTKPIPIKTLGELIDRTRKLSPDFYLVDSNGNSITLRMGDNSGVLIIESQ